MEEWEREAPPEAAWEETAQAQGPLETAFVQPAALKLLTNVVCHATVSPAPSAGLT